MLLIGLVLLVVEAFVASYGLLAIAGIASLTLGGLMLIDSPTGFLRVSPLIVVPVALAPAAIAVFLLESLLLRLQAAQLQSE